MRAAVAAALAAALLAACSDDTSYLYVVVHGPTAAPVPSLTVTLTVGTAASKAVTVRPVDGKPADLTGAGTLAFDLTVPGRSGAAHLDVTAVDAAGGSYYAGKDVTLVAGSVEDVDVFLAGGAVDGGVDLRPAADLILSDTAAPDMATAVDAASPVDAAMPVDAAVPDAAVAADLAMPDLRATVADLALPDFAAAPDLATVAHDLAMPDLATGTATLAITSVSPSQGPAHSMFTLTITGSGFASGATVTLDGRPVTGLGVTSTTITGTTPFDVCGRKPLTVTVGGKSVTVPYLLTNCSNVQFNDAKHVDTQSGTGYAVAAGDLDGDGLSDVVIARGAASNAAFAWFPDGKGGWTSTMLTFTMPMPMGQPSGVALVDLDRDGKLDVVTTSYTPAIVAVFLNQSTPGKPSFAAATQTMLMQGIPLAVAAGDFDEDGKNDVAVSVEGAGVVVHHGDGTGGFSDMTPSPKGPTEGVRMAVGDADGDGYPDRIVLLATCGYTLVAGQDVTEFPANVTPVAFSPGAGADDVAVANLGLAGKLSAAVADAGGAACSSGAPSNALSIFADVAAGGMATSTVPLGDVANTVTLADVDLDGKLDAVAGLQSNGLAVAPGMGNATFAAPTNYVALGNPAHAAADDFNGDGLVDFAFANSDGTLDVVLNASK